MKPEPFVSLSGVTKTFPGLESPALQELSARIHPGRITGLAGPDGAGKTTFLRLLTGLMTADSGEIAVGGFDPRTEPERIHRIIGYLPQKFGLYEDLTVAENLALYADLREVSGPARRAQTGRLLEMTDLARFQKRLAGRLSGGMKQKLGLACALLGEPKLLLLDEPGVGVDPLSRRELWTLLGEMLNDELAVIWSTAYLEEAEKCSTVLLLNNGQLLYDGPPAELLGRVEGRVWEVDGLQGTERRRALLELIKDPAVLDGVVRGRKLKILLRPEALRPEEAPGDWRPAAPGFEDAFLDLLDRNPPRDSALARETAEKPDLDGPVVEARGLTKRYGDFTAVRDNTFQIRRGEIFGLLGPNGAGKSTTFKMMCGLARPSAGTALVSGLDLARAGSRARSRIGYMAQKFSLYEHLSVRQNLDFFAGVYGLGGRRGRNRVELMLDIFELRAFTRLSAGALPLGHKQRLALACAVMHEPDVLFLDEPTSGVDPLTRREFWLHINSLAAKGVTVMVTTHFLDEAEYCDRIGLIYRGLNIATGTPDELKALARAPGRQDPTLEEAFIDLVLKNDAPEESGGHYAQT